MLVEHLYAISSEPYYYKQQQFIRTHNNDEFTALHEAAVGSRTDVVEYICRSSSAVDELILKKDADGGTALHYAKNREIARLLVNSVLRKNKKGLLLSVDDNQWTALHSAAESGETDVVEYLCSLSLPDDELILKDDADGWTALHYAYNRDIAKMLVDSVLPKNRNSFLLSVDKSQHTALHTAAGSGKTGVVEYLCSLRIAKNKLILKKDANGWTALHYAENRAVAEVLVQLVSSANRKGFILSTDKKQRTALHIAAKSGRTDVVEYFCSLLRKNDKHILHEMKDIFGRTALHFAENREIAKLLVESVLPKNKKSFVLSVTYESHFTALHRAAIFGKTQVVEYLCSLSEFSVPLILAEDCFNSTAMHYATNKEIVISMLNGLQPEKIVKLSSVVNNEGNTIIMSLAKYGQHESLAALLEHIADVKESDDWKAFFKQRNRNYQNIFHLAALSFSLDGIHNVLDTHLSHLNFNEIMYPDVYGNTPIHYVAAKYNITVFADFMLRVSLPMRQEITNFSNSKLVDIKIIIQQKTFSELFYIKNILADDKHESLESKYKHQIFLMRGCEQIKHPERFYKYDDKFLKVLNYCLNEYPLRDFACTTSHSFSLSAACQQNPEPKSREPSKHPPPTVIDITNVKEPKQMTVQNELNELNNQDYKGKPKIVVIQCPVKEADLNLIPPDPDYLILTVKYHTDSYERNPAIDMAKYKDTSHLIAELSCDPDVKKVSVNSTLNKRYPRDDDGCLADYGEERETDDRKKRETGDGEERETYGGGERETDYGGERETDNGKERETNDSKERETEDGEEGRPVDGEGSKLHENRTQIEAGQELGKALIICNQCEDPVYEVDRKEALDNAKMVLKDCFEFKIEVRRDEKQMLSSISEFSRSEGHGSMAALTIISHGDQGKIIGGDNKSLCSVQEVVDSFNMGNVQNIKKLMFLSYCRGTIEPKYNRIPDSFESSDDFPWTENEVSIMYQPVKKSFDETLRREVWNRQPTFPRLEVPVNCYIMFSTLPDSSSKSGLMFKCLSEHLRDLTSDYRSKLLTPPTSSSDDITEQTDRQLSTYDSALPEERKDKPVMTVNLLDLLTDVAGKIRDTSRSTQYANLCYTVDKNSQQIFIDIFKPSSESE